MRVRVREGWSEEEGEIEVVNLEDERGEDMGQSRFERLEIIGRTNFVAEDFSFVPKEKIVWVPDDYLRREPPRIDNINVEYSS